MDNPLKRFFPVEEREDGVYIQVTRETRDALSMDAVIAALENAMVLNYDIPRMKDVISRGRGAFEKIGALFEHYNAELESYVDVRLSQMRAVMKISAQCIVAQMIPSLPAMLRCLKRKGVSFGIKNDVLVDVLRRGIYDMDILIAEGVAPVRGENAYLKYEISIKPDATPALLADGSVDFRDIKTFTQVAKGQVIGKKIPATMGIAGRAVTGEDIPAERGIDKSLVEGKNIAVSDDGRYLIVTKSGIIYEESGILNIRESLSIPRDVDFSTGNIKFSGTITIGGNVLPGFSVESEDDILIRGEVEGATIRSRGGTVTIVRGVIGKGQTTIYGKKGVHIGFAQEAAIITDGLLQVDRYCLHCTGVCDTFEMTHSDSSFIGGELKAFSSVKAANLGSDKEIQTRVLLVDKERDAIQAKCSELEQLQKKLNDEIAPVKKQLSSKAAIFKKAGDLVSDRQKDELKKWIEQHNSLTIKIDYVQKKVTELKESLQKPVRSQGTIQVLGNVYGGTLLDFYGLTKQIQTIMTNKRFVLAAGGDIGTMG